MNKNIFHELIKKCLQDTASKLERQDFASSEQVSRNLFRQWEDGDNKTVDKAIEERLWRRINTQLNTRQHTIIRLSSKRLAVACLLIVLIISTWSLMNIHFTDNLFSDDITTCYAQQSSKYVLPDNSIVWIKAGSTIHYKKDFNRDRTIWLEGEAMFEVMKQSNHPFKVHMENAVVEVKGTVFNVINHKNIGHEVTLYQGVIEFNSLWNKKKIRLKPNQRITYTSGQDSIRVSDMNTLRWSEGRFQFNDIYITELLKHIEDIYHVSIQLASDVPSHYRFTGTIRYNETLENVLNKICLNTGIHFQKQANTFILYNKHY